jgi:hypothetical protein
MGRKSVIPHAAREGRITKVTRMRGSEARNALDPPVNWLTWRTGALDGKSFSGGYHRYPSGLRGSRSPLGKDIAYAANLGSDPLQLLLDVFVAAIQVIHAVDNRLAVSHQRRQHQRG